VAAATVGAVWGGEGSLIPVIQTSVISAISSHLSSESEATMIIMRTTPWGGGAWFKKLHKTSIFHKFLSKFIIFSPYYELKTICIFVFPVPTLYAALSHRSFQTQRVWVVLCI
jgi:hypothetical protein